MVNELKKKAIELAINYEKKRGKNPERVNKFKEGYDIKSEDRLIEIKINNKKNDLLLSFKNFKKLGKDVNKYYIYLFYNLEDKPKLKVLDPDFILKNINLLTLINIKSYILDKIKEEEL